MRALAPILLLCGALVAGCKGRAAPSEILVAVPAPGRSAPEVEREITAPLETALAGLPGVAKVRSTSSGGASAVTLELARGTNVFAARRAARERLEQARARLPQDAGFPVLAAPGRAGEAVRYTLASATHDGVALRRLHETLVRERLLRTPGVADVETCGGREAEAVVRVDAARLAAHGLALPQVLAALRAKSLTLPAGRLVAGDRDVVVRGLQLGGVREVEACPIGGTAVPVLVRDVATVSVGAAWPECVALEGGPDGPREVVAGRVRLQDGVDAARGRDAVLGALDAAARALPPGVRLRVVPPELPLLRRDAAPLPGGSLDAHVAGGRDLLRRLRDVPEFLPPLVEVRSRERTGGADGELTLLMTLSRGLPAGRVRDLEGQVAARLEGQAGPPLLSWERPPRGATARVVEVQVRGPDLERLEALASDARARLAAVPGVAAVSTVSTSRPEVTVTPDREALARLGVPVSAVSTALAAATAGSRVGELVEAGERVPLVVRLTPTGGLGGVEGLATVTIPRAGGAVPLGMVARIQQSAAPGAIVRVDGQRAQILRVGLRGDAAADARKAVLRALADLALPAGYAVVLDEEPR